MDFGPAITAYRDAIVADYREWSAMMMKDKPAEAIDAHVAKFADGIEFKYGKKYIKVIRTDSQRSVHSFIVLGPDKKFQVGDILKSAGWAAPARNRARGNIFGKYRIRWTGAEYLK